MNESKLTSEQKLMRDLSKQAKSMDEAVLLFMELEGRDVRYALEVWDDLEAMKSRTLYDSSMDNTAMNFCLLGATNEQLADALDVCPRTLETWIERYPGLRKAIFDGRRGADAKVARSLYERAVGSKVTEVKFATYEGQISDTVEYEKQLPPDVSAARLWLFNREKEKWQNEGRTREPSHHHEGQREGRERRGRG